jgi:hypothetical protein
MLETSYRILQGPWGDKIEGANEITIGRASEAGRSLILRTSTPLFTLPPYQHSAARMIAVLVRSASETDVRQRPNDRQGAPNSVEFPKYVSLGWVMVRFNEDECAL